MHYILPPLYFCNPLYLFPYYYNWYYFLARNVAFFSTIIFIRAVPKDCPLFSHPDNQTTRTLKATPLGRRSFGYSSPLFYSSWWNRSSRSRATKEAETQAPSRRGAPLLLAFPRLRPLLKGHHFASVALSCLPAADSMIDPRATWQLGKPSPSVYPTYCHAGQWRAHAGGYIRQHWWYLHRKASNNRSSGVDHSWDPSKIEAIFKKEKASSSLVFLKLIPSYPIEVATNPYPSGYKVSKFQEFVGRKEDSKEHVVCSLDSIGPFADDTKMCLRALVSNW